MKKTEQILNGKTDKIYGEVVLREKDAHKAMQETAVQFAEWCFRNRWFLQSDGTYHYVFEHPTHISKLEYATKYIKLPFELFEIFNNEK
jgi:hypothetical protein